MFRPFKLPFVVYILTTVGTAFRAEMLSLRSDHWVV